MHAERAPDPDDPRLEAFRGVRDPELVRRRGLFVAEGRRVVEALLDHAPERLVALVLTEAAEASLGARLLRVPERAEVFRAEGPAALERLTGVRFHQGCLALARLPRERAWADLPLATGPAPSLVVLLERTTDPDNVGSIFRSAAAFGADAVLLSPGCAHPLYRKALRTGLGTSLVVPFATSSDWGEDLGRVARAGYVRVGLTPAPDAEDLAGLEGPGRPGRVALLVGSEERGLSEETLGVCERRVRIRMTDRVDSLNAAVAAALALRALSPLPAAPGT